MSDPKTAPELESLIRQRTGSANGEIAILVQPLAGRTPNWDCTVRYADPGRGMGPSADFVREVAALQRRFHLQE